MKRKLLLSMGVVCSIVFYSCSKTATKEDQLLKTDELQAERRKGPQSSNCGCSTTDELNPIFDSLCLIAKNATLQQLGSGFSFTEGPATDKFGNIFFTDQPNDKIYKWAANNGQITLFKSNTGRSNGMYFDEEGYLITCADMYGELRRYDKNGNYKVLVNGYKSKLLNGPNDVWVNPDNNGVYFTDPLFGRDYWDASDPRKVNLWPGTSQQAANPPTTAPYFVGDLGGYVYYLSPNRKILTRIVTESLGWTPDKWPNGVIGTPDGKKLYVNKWDFNTDVSKTWVFDILPNGALSNMKLFANMGGDGMTMDEEGNVYIANNRGVTAFDKKGNRILNIPIPPGGSNNITFGDSDRKTLFITGQDKIYGIRMKVKGAQKNQNNNPHH